MGTAGCGIEHGWTRRPAGRHSGNSMTSPDVRLRSIPHPYRCVLAICSDLDETPDQSVYREIVRFLNTNERTVMGPGVGLEVGNSIYFDMPPDQFAYSNTDDAGREMVRTLIRSGHIDVLHSYGDLATTRSAAARALEELDRHACRLRVWVDHGQANTNLGADIMRGQGDLPGDEAYHADLTTAYGIRYVWRGRVTSVIGQDACHTLRGVWNGRYPIASTRTVAKELAKHALGRLGNAKYAMHGPNALLRPITLRDGSRAVEFLRCNPHWRGPRYGDTAVELGEVLTARFLDRLVARGAACILYTHLGKLDDPHKPFSHQTCRALHNLARRREAGEIMVTTTARLLGYIAARDRLRYSVACAGERVIITLDAVDDPVDGMRRPTAEEVQGITFVVEGRHPCEVRLHREGSVACKTIHQNKQTYTSIPWRSLSPPMLSV